MMSGVPGIELQTSLAQLQRNLVDSNTPLPDERLGYGGMHLAA